MMVPEARESARLVPPSTEQLNTESLREWLLCVASVITERVANTAAGGTLVLMTGYERLQLLERCLLRAAGGELADRLIVQTRYDMPLSQAMRQFKTASLEGRKPVWLSLGGAWTGIDLRDDRFPDSEAFKDNLLTDLVIPALPFGMNRSLTHESRVAYSGFTAEKDEALRMFLQGLGRLVRRDGLRNRRIWVLDGRIFSPKHRGMTAEFLRVVKSYPSLRVFDLPSR